MPCWSCRCSTWTGRQKSESLIVIARNHFYWKKGEPGIRLITMSATGYRFVQKIYLWCGHERCWLRQIWQTLWYPSCNGWCGRCSWNPEGHINPGWEPVDSNMGLFENRVPQNLIRWIIICLSKLPFLEYPMKVVQ